MSTEGVPKAIEENLFYHLKKKGFAECREYGAAYAACCKDRTLSVVWACRKEMKDYSNCMAQHTKNLEIVKQRWLAAGSPTTYDWGALLKDL